MVATDSKSIPEFKKKSGDHLRASSLTCSSMALVLEVMAEGKRKADANASTHVCPTPNFLQPFYLLARISSEP